MSPNHRNEIGHEHEALVASCFNAPWVKSPEWLTDLRRATPEEDRKGIDIVAETDVGDLCIQVKSSKRFLQRHLEKHPDIPVIVCQYGESEKRVRERLLHLLKKMRNRKLDAARKYAAQQRKLANQNDNQAQVNPCISKPIP